MKPIVVSLSVLVCLLVISSSCKKSADTPPETPKSNTVLLTQSSWKLQSLAIDQNQDGTGDMDATSMVAACQLDNTYAFKADGSGTMDESTTKCVETDPQTQPFTWSFKQNETILSGSFSFNTGDTKIWKLNETNLVIAYDNTVGSSTVHLLATLKH